MKSKKNFIFLLLIFCFSTGAFAQQNHLKVKLSVSVKHVSVAAFLKKLEQQGGFLFSYNSDILNADSIVSYKSENETVKSILDHLFYEQYEYKSVGKHIIILKNNYDKKTTTENTDINYTITGYIVDVVTGESIISATVYDIQGSFIAKTNPKGEFSITIPDDNQYRSLNFSKKGYLDTIIIIRPVDCEELNIPLQPTKISLQQIQAKPADLNTLREINELSIVNLMVAEDVQMHAYNLSNIQQYRPFQASLLPYAGTQLSSSGIFINSFSFNVLAGYSGGVNGVEIGGLLNMNRLGVKGFQLAGLGNISGGNIKGVQLGGLFNNSGGAIIGLQLAGIYNHSKDSILGVQLAGIANHHSSWIKGSQIAGIYNHCGSTMRGLQLAGIANMSVGDVEMAQISGITNYGNNIDGLQLTSITNIANGDVHGAQVATISNLIRGTNNGSQLSVIHNYATKQNGFQLALFNSCDSIQGVSIGLFTFALHGYHAFEYSFNDVFYGQLSFKTGGRHFYNIFSMGLGETDDFIWGPGYGFGTKIKLSRLFDLSLELTATQVNETRGWTNHLNLLNKFTTTFEWKIGKRFELYFGPNFNVHVSNLKDGDTGLFSSKIANNPFYTYNTSYTNTQLWVGFTAGFRF